MAPWIFAFVVLGGANHRAHVYRDYTEAYHAAHEQGKMLLVDIGTRLDLDSLDIDKADDFVLCKVPADVEFLTEGEERKLLDHPSMSDLEGEPGVVVIDLKHIKHLREVVSGLPERHVTAENVNALLDLPAGSLTQRTLLWALRTHPERPATAFAASCPLLMDHAQRHSHAQAGSNSQYHNLPMHIAQSEIVAESWPWNRNVTDAAIDIVHSWRQSSGHWGAACRPYSYSGYDMKSSGQKWFATGVFR